MSSGDILGLVALGIAAGVSSGLLGVGGGVLMVPALVIFLDLSQLRAEATSLLAIVLVASLGAWRQHRYGNLRLRDAVAIGVLSPIGVVAGAVLANAVPERALELSFAAVQLYFAWRLGRRALRPSAESADSVGSRR
jgi:uncharacterized membrane protein YfcA